jgi:hypothetical protein
MKTEKQKPTTSKTTLGQLGPTFPVPVLGADGKPLKDQSFSFLPWDLEMEEKLGDIQQKADGVGSFVANLLDSILDTFCGQDFQKMDKDRRIISINQLEFPNVMYAYIYLRTEELGFDLNLNITCPSCKKLIEDYVADLSTLDVFIKTAEHDRKIKYDLVHPIPVVGSDKTVYAVMLDVSKWDAMSRATREIAENPGKMKRLLMKSSICGLHDDKGLISAFVDVETLIGKMKKVDIERLLAAAMKNNGGPHMAIGGKCPMCKSDFAKVLDWGYETFFDSSSL